MFQANPGPYEPHRGKVSNVYLSIPKRGGHISYSRFRHLPFRHLAKVKWANVKRFRGFLKDTSTGQTDCLWTCWLCRGSNLLPFGYGAIRSAVLKSWRKQERKGYQSVQPLCCQRFRLAVTSPREKQLKIWASDYLSEWFHALTGRAQCSPSREFDAEER